MSGKKGTWKWLQPYEQDGKDKDGNPLEAQFANLEVVEELGRSKFAEGPYTFVEGYLQLVGNLGTTGAKELAAQR